MILKDRAIIATSRQTLRDRFFFSAIQLFQKCQSQEITEEQRPATNILMLPLIPRSQSGGAKWEFLCPQDEVFFTPVPLCWHPYHLLQAAPTARHLQTTFLPAPCPDFLPASRNSLDIFLSSEFQMTPEFSEMTCSETNQTPSTFLGKKNQVLSEAFFPHPSTILVSSETSSEVISLHPSCLWSKTSSDTLHMTRKCHTGTCQGWRKMKSVSAAPTRPVWE